jgi:GxxExxY protein
MEPQINADERRSKLSGISQKVIGCAFEVANKLGCGFLEKVYENALAHELRKCGVSVQQQFPVAVRYDGELVGEYIADLLVEGCVLVELKAVKEMDSVHAAQCMNYLKATSLKVCLLINFGKPRIEIKRYVNKY